LIIILHGIVHGGIQAVEQFPVVGQAVAVPVNADRAVIPVFAGSLDVLQPVVVKRALGDIAVDVFVFFAETGEVGARDQPVI
jgi:hypothetical protein